jgi:hypothetical protein
VFYVVRLEASQALADGGACLAGGLVDGDAGGHWGCCGEGVLGLARHARGGEADTAWWILHSLDFPSSSV